MKSLIAIAIGLSFICIAVFGIFAMNHGTEHGGCIAETANGALCPNGSNPFAMLSFHLDTFKSFSTAAFAGFMTSLLLLLALASVFVFRSLFGSRVSSSPSKSFFYARSGEQPLPVRESVRHWLALHENSPSLI